MLESGIDLATIKKRLATSPIEVIELLAKGITNQNKKTGVTRRRQQKNAENNNNPSE